MRRILTFLAFVLLASASHVDVLHKSHITKLQEPSQVHPGVRAFTTGTSFVFAVTNSHISDNDNSYTENITLLVTNFDTAKTATVTVSTPSSIFSTATFTVAPQATAAFSLPPQIQTNYRDTHTNAYQITNRSISLTADTTVTVVVRNAHSDGLSEDMYVVYPVCALGKTYRTVGDETTFNGARSTNIWSIVALQDNTTISIYPPITNPPSVTIMAGQIMTLAADIFPLTNYQIDTNVPVAVISGAVCGFGYFNPAICNYEAIMLFPVQDSGVTFPYTQFISEDRGELMLFAQNHNTSIYINGNYFDTINDGGYYIFSVLGSVLFTTSQPSYVVAVSSIRSDGQGSPFLAHIPSVSQFTNQSWLQVSTGLTGRTTPTSHYIRLQTDLKSTGKLTVNNWVVDPLLYQRQGKSNYYVADFKVPPGAHVIQSTDPSIRYSATVYGFSHFTAYAYTPGIDVPTTGNC